MARLQSTIDKQKAKLQGKPRPKVSAETKQQIVLDHRTGKFTQAEIARKHRVSDQYVSKLTQGIEKDLLPIVESQMQMFRTLAGLSGEEQEHVYSTAKAKCDVVDMVNYGMAKTAAYLINKVNLQASVGELVGVTQGLKNVRDVVDPVPKQQTNIQINQTAQLEKSVRDMSDEDVHSRIKELQDRLRIINP
jgi:transposase-like protein